MSVWQELLGVAACGFLIWWLYKGIKGNPGAFSKESLGKSFTTMGILALLLMGTVALAVHLLRR